MYGFDSSRIFQRLDSEQMASLLEHSSARLPAWLAVVCEEMRVFGDSVTISSKIRHLPDSLEELMREVLKRLLREDETNYMEQVLFHNYYHTQSRHSHWHSLGRHRCGNT